MAVIKTPKKLVRPGQWVLAKLGEWPRKKYRELEHKDKAWICIVPSLRPQYNTRDNFTWQYTVVFRWFREAPLAIGEREYFSSETQLWCNEEKDGNGYKWGGCYTSVSTYELNLISMVHDWRSRVAFDLHECTLDREGKCGFLYDPASDNPEDCPGGDYSLYQCDKCDEFISPWSNDAGELLCPKCDCVTGIYCDAETADQMERARALASYVGPAARRHLEQTWCWMADNSRQFDNGATPRRLHLYREDQFSFGFALQYYVDGQWKNGMNGGIIMHGPHAEINGDGEYLFSRYDYTLEAVRPATIEEIGAISWSTHT